MLTCCQKSPSLRLRAAGRRDLLSGCAWWEATASGGAGKVSTGENSSWDNVRLKRSLGIILQPRSNKSFRHSPQRLRSSPENRPVAGGKVEGAGCSPAPRKCLHLPREDPPQPPPPIPIPSAALPLGGPPPGRPRAGSGPAEPTQGSLLGPCGRSGSAPHRQRLGFATGTGTSCLHRPVPCLRPHQQLPRGGQRRCRAKGAPRAPSAAGTGAPCLAQKAMGAGGG